MLSQLNSGFLVCNAPITFDIFAFLVSKVNLIHLPKLENTMKYFHILDTQKDANLKRHCYKFYLRRPCGHTSKISDPDTS